MMSPISSGTLFIPCAGAFQSATMQAGSKATQDLNQSKIGDRIVSGAVSVCMSELALLLYSVCHRAAHWILYRKSSEFACRKSRGLTKLPASLVRAIRQPRTKPMGQQAANQLLRPARQAKCSLILARPKQLQTTIHVPLVSQGHCMSLPNATGFQVNVCINSFACFAVCCCC